MTVLIQNDVQHRILIVIASAALGELSAERAFTVNTGFDAVYYEPTASHYELGKILRVKYESLPWIEIESHSRVPELTVPENRDFPKLKRHLIIGPRKTYKYVPNYKVSDWLVPYTSSGCRVMCLYCYLVYNYNKCAYLRLFINREQMLDRILKKDAEVPTPQTFEVGGNSDLVLENTITDNLIYTIERFAREDRGHLTFSTKFGMAKPLPSLDHGGKTIFRISINPEELTRRIELGTSPLHVRIGALSDMTEAGYPMGMLFAPIILVPDWKRLYGELIEQPAGELSPKVTQNDFIEIILMTYSFAQNAINTNVFPNGMELFNRETMTGRGCGKYCYRNDIHAEVESFLREKPSKELSNVSILYIS